VEAVCAAVNFALPSAQVRKNGKWVTIARELGADGALAPPTVFLPCELSHNVALSCDGEKLHALGNDLDERGLWACTAIVPRQGSFFEWSKPVLVVSGLQNVSGCVDRRATAIRSGRCEFDGRLSTVRTPSGDWLLFARANMAAAGGGRHVSVARSMDGRQWLPFHPISIADYDDHVENEHSNIYFFAVSLHEDRLFAIFPAVSRRLGAGVFLSSSFDGLAWSRPAKLLQSIATGPRTPDHPVAGLQFSPNGSVVTYHVMHNVSQLPPFIIEKLTPAVQASIAPFVCRYTHALPPTQPSRSHNRRLSTSRARRSRTAKMLRSMSHRDGVFKFPPAADQT
jgi:hypothetical protein